MPHAGCVAPTCTAVKTFRTWLCAVRTTGAPISSLRSIRGAQQHGSGVLVALAAMCVGRALPFPVQGGSSKPVAECCAIGCRRVDSRKLPRTPPRRCRRCETSGRHNAMNKKGLRVVNSMLDLLFRRHCVLDNRIVGCITVIALAIVRRKLLFYPKPDFWPSTAYVGTFAQIRGKLAGSAGDGRLGVLMVPGGCANFRPAISASIKSVDFQL